MSAINISALQTEYGQFYAKGSQNLRNLYLKLYKEAEFDNLFTYLPTEDTIVRNVKVTSNPVLQAFQKAFTPAGGMGFLPIPINLHHIKADDDVYPDEIEQSYIGFLASNNLDREQWPLVRYWVENILFKQFIEDIDNEAFKAVFTAPTAGTAGTPAQSMNGFKKVIQELVAAGEVSPIATGALSTTATTFVTQIEAFVQGIPAHIRKRFQMTIAVSDVLETRFREGMRTKYNMNYPQAELNKVIDYPNITVKGFNALQGSNKIFTSPAANLILAMKRPTELVQIGKKDLRLIQASTDHWRGYGVADPRYFYTNDLENV